MTAPSVPVRATLCLSDTVGRLRCSKAELGDAINLVIGDAGQDAGAHQEAGRRLVFRPARASQCAVATDPDKEAAARFKVTISEASRSSGSSVCTAPAAMAARGMP